MSIDEVIQFCQSEGPDQYQTRNSFLRRLYSNKESLLPISIFLKDHESLEFQKRIEGNSIDIYTNDVDFYEKVSSTFNDIVDSQFEPDTNNISAFDDPNIILAKRYPHERYQFKVFLLPHKLKGNISEKENIVRWIKSQNKKITLSDAVERWFLETDWNWDRRYVLVEDENILLMLKLRCSNVVGRIYKYVIG